MKRPKTLCCLAVLALLALNPVTGLARSAQELATKGTTLVQEGKWQEALEVYRQLTEAEPGNPQHWAFLGLAYRNLEQWEMAVAAYEKGLELNGTSVMALAGLAITLEKAGQPDRAFAFLNRAVDNGLSSQGLDQNPVFEGLRGHPQFAETRKLAEKKSNPCRYESPYDDFDFWVGDWDVQVGGKKMAENKITKEMNGCIIRERYHNQFGYEGESINYFDPETGMWKQNWVDLQGGVVRYTGGLRGEGMMHMEGTSASPGGTTQLARVTWTLQPDGTVHHYLEQSADGGKSWQSAFDAIYVKSDRPDPAQTNKQAKAP